jgi:GDP-L-fucose synthase
MDEILILGGDGLLGSCFWLGKKVGRKDADLTNYQETYELIKKHNPLWVINCAGKVGGVKANIENKFEFFEINTLINLNVIKACMELKVPNLISFLSTCIFPDSCSLNGDLNENHLHKGEPHESNYAYAYSKRMIDVLSQIAREKGFNYQCLIPTNLYGYNDNYDLNNSHVIPALIRKIADGIIEAKKQGSNVVDFQVWGTGNPIREFLFANDVVGIVYKIIDENIKFNNMIISDDKSYSIKEVVDLIISIYRELLNKEFDFLRTFNSTKPDGQYKKTTDTSRFQILVDTPITDLKVGLKLVIADYWKSRN